MRKLARSKMGHDKGKVYVVYKEEDEYVFLVDGVSKTVSRPKKKNKKHVQPIVRFPQKVADILESAMPNEDECIKKALKEYEKPVENGAPYKFREV